MKSHPKQLGVQMAATACLYNLSKGEVGAKVHPACLTQIVNLTLLAMENFPNHQQVRPPVPLVVIMSALDFTWIMEKTPHRMLCPDVVFFFTVTKECPADSVQWSDSEWCGKWTLASPRDVWSTVYVYVPIFFKSFLNCYLYETLGKNFIKEENNKKFKFLHFVSLFLLFIKMKNKELFAEERRKSALMVNEDQRKSKVCYIMFYVGFTSVNDFSPLFSRLLTGTAVPALWWSVSASF